MDLPFGKDSPDAVKDDQLRVMQVSRFPSGANIWNRLKRGNYYEMFSKPKGYVLFINNWYFEKTLGGPRLGYRDGTVQDQKRLSAVLTKIGFAVCRLLEQSMCFVT